MWMLGTLFAFTYSGYTFLSGCPICVGMHGAHSYIRTWSTPPLAIVIVSPQIEEGTPTHLVTPRTKEKITWMPRIQKRMDRSILEIQHFLLLIHFYMAATCCKLKSSTFRSPFPRPESPLLLFKLLIHEIFGAEKLKPDGR